VTAGDVVAFCLVTGAATAGTIRWLRVAQREHYLPRSVTRFAVRWWRSTPLNGVGFVLGAAAALAALGFAPIALLAGAVVVGAPVGLSFRGRTSKLHWTRRLTTVAAATLLIEGVVIAAGALLGSWTGAVVAAALFGLGSPLGLDVALSLTAPIEHVLGTRYVRSAVAKLERIRPTIVAVTGSYGKTSTKGYIAHLVGAYKSTLPSPHSYNNRAGLSRTVNEHLGVGTEVLVAEMGAYGPGEIAALCEWLPPHIAVITAIGPAHLERFKTLERTLSAKTEIAERADVVVLNVDDPRLSSVAASLRTGAKRVVGASGTDRGADVAVVAVPEGLELSVSGRRVGTASLGAGERPASLSNAASAAAVALELGIPPEAVLARLSCLPSPPNRLQRYAAEGGYIVLDDTFNSNPAGARLALARLAAEGGGRRVVVTPGMVELGRSQFEENAAFAEAASEVATDLVVVARTNRRALLAGAARPPGGAGVITFRRLDQAVAWVRDHLGPGDAVLYENDLPDHFP
jgi:UDP-N-acetylmuramoyl-tripeptide--D-alanyl-D-alanine ligase